ncbi:unnamed protein product [Lampetra planeri]
MRTDSTRQGGQDNEGRQSEMFHADELRGKDLSRAGAHFEGHGHCTRSPQRTSRAVAEAVEQLGLSAHLKIIDAARAVLEMHGAELGGRAPLYGVVLLVCSAHWSRWHRVPFCIDEYHAKGVPVVPKGSTQ